MITHILGCLWLIGVGVFWADLFFQKGLDRRTMVRLFFAGLFWPVVLPLVLTGKRPEPQQHQHPQGVQVPPWVQAMHARHAELDGDDLIGDLPPRTLDRRNPHL